MFSVTVPMTGGDAYERFTSWCRSIQYHKVENLFAVHEISDGASTTCPTCSESVETQAESKFLVHMHILEPTDKLHTHGVGESVHAAKSAACAAAIALLESLEPEIFSLRRKRLRVRLEDFGVTVPKTGHMMLLEDGREEGLSGLPEPLVELVAAIVPEEDDDDSPKAAPVMDMAAVELLSKKFLSWIPNLSTEQVEQTFSKIGLSLCDEMNLGMNVFLFAALVALALRLDLDTLATDEKLKLAFSKVMEQVIVFNSERFSGFDRVVARLLRFFAAYRSLPFMAKNRLECLAAHMSVGGQSIMCSQRPKADAETEKKLKDIISHKTPEKSYLDSLFSEFAKINIVIRELFGVDGSIYGSLVNGFPTSSSDIDVVVNLPNVGPEERGDPDSETGLMEDSSDLDSEAGDLVNLNKLHDAVKERYGEEFSVSKIESARVPILIVKKGDIEINISFNHQVVIHNSALLRTYSSIHPKVRELVVLVKHWAKLRDVNDALQGTLSSYSYVLLVISYLQSKKCLPDLQCPPEQLVARPLPKRLSDNGRCSTWFLEAFEPSTFASYTEKLDQAPLSELLCDFFKHYLYEINYVTEVVSVAGLVTGAGGEVACDSSRRTVLKRHLLRSRDDVSKLDVIGLRKRTWLTIVDPFEIGRMLGTSARGAELLVKEMRRAVDLLMEGAIEELYTPYSRRDGFRFSVIPLRKMSQRDNVCEYAPRQTLRKATVLTMAQHLETIRILASEVKECKNLDVFRVLCFLNNAGLPSTEQLVTLGLATSEGVLDLSHTTRLKQLIAQTPPQGANMGYASKAGFDYGRNEKFGPNRGKGQAFKGKGNGVDMNNQVHVREPYSGKGKGRTQAPRVDFGPAGPACQPQLLAQADTNERQPKTERGKGHSAKGEPDSTKRGEGKGRRKKSSPVTSGSATPAMVGRQIGTA